MINTLKNLLPLLFIGVFLTPLATPRYTTATPVQLHLATQPYQSLSSLARQRQETLNYAEENGATPTELQGLREDFDLKERKLKRHQ